MQKHILYTQQAKKYKGHYIAVRSNKIIASGRDAEETFKLAKKLLGKKKKVEGLYYIPTKRDLLTALCVFHTFN